MSELLLTLGGRLGRHHNICGHCVEHHCCGTLQMFKVPHEYKKEEDYTCWLQNDMLFFMTI